MLEIIPNKPNSEMTIESREVAEMVDKRHADLLRDIKNYEEALLTDADLRSLDFFIQSSYIDGKGEERLCYLLTRKGCDMVANKMTGEKGIIFTARYVTKFEEMEKAQNSKYIALPQNYKQALLALVAAEEEKERLHGQLQIAAPMVDFYKSVTGSKSTIDMAKAAKVLNYHCIGRNTLFEILRKSNVLQKDNTPYQEYVDRGWFRLVESKYTKPDGSTCISLKTVVFQKGLDGIAKILSNLGFKKVS
jgi:anti-repressor protein